MGSYDAVETDLAELDVDVLICGTGPAGASLACFLGFNGITGLMIGQASSTSETPRAHYTNRATFECLRDIGLEYECRQVATPIQFGKFYRICKSMAGEEYSRAYAFGTDPARLGDYAEAGPCEAADLPQNRLEPILTRYATQHGFHLRFDSRLVSFTDKGDAGRVESVVEDLLTRKKTLIRSKYLCGADGANSTIARELQLPLHDTPNGSLAINVHLEADMTHLMANSPGLLHVLARPDKPPPDFGLMGIARFVVPWTEWLIVLIAHPGLKKITASEAEIMGRVRELIDDDSIKLRLKSISTWRINECYAEQYSKGNVFCLGDAVHRHPPHNGLGSNTCIQDSYNLAWKLALVLGNRASPSLLSTYNDERQPIGKYIVQRANDTHRLHMALYTVLGLLEPHPEKKRQIDAEFEEDSARGEERRSAFRKCVRDLDQERHGLGAEMNQWYRSSAVYTEDEEGEPPMPASDVERTLYHVKSTYPGFRVPHAWLGVPTKFGPRPPAVSTRDLAGHGRFTLLTGIGGKIMWESAAAHAGQTVGVDIQTYSVGFGQDYEDTFFIWHEMRGVEEKGAVLVRPDRVVAWRCKSMPSADGEACAKKLLAVMQKILGHGV